VPPAPPGGCADSGNYRGKSVRPTQIQRGVVRRAPPVGAAAEALADGSTGASSPGSSPRSVTPPPPGGPDAEADDSAKLAKRLRGTMLDEPEGPSG
jgi:hypothetical protein